MAHNFPFPANETERLQALHNYRILDSLPEKSFDRITRLASVICGVPVALISFVDEDRQWFKSCQSLDIKETDREVSFCQYTILGDKLMIVEDTLQDERFVHNQLVTSDPGFRFYAGCPLLDKDKHALGTLCVLDKNPQKLSESQQQALQDLADEVIELLEARLHYRHLENYQRLFDSSLDLLCIVNREGRFTRINQSFLKTLGWEQHEILHHSFSSFIHPEDLEKAEAEFEKLLNGEKTDNFYTRTQSKNGQYAHIQWSASPDPSQNDVYAIGRDVTEEHQAEARVRESEKRNRLFIEQAPSAIAMFDTHMCYMAASQQWIKDYQLEGVDLSGKSHYAIFPEISEDWKAIHQEALSGKTIRKEEELFLRSDGIEQWLTWEVKPWYNDEDQIGGMLMYTADITQNKTDAQERGRLEEIINLTSENAGIGAWVMDFKLNKLSWSDMTRSIYEVDDDYQPVPEDMYTFFKNQHYFDWFREKIKELMASGPPFSADFEIITGRNRVKWVRCSALTEIKNGECIRLYGTLQDVSLLKRKEQELKISESKFKGAFEFSASGIALLDMEGNWMQVNKRLCQLIGYTENALLQLSYRDITFQEDYERDLPLFQQLVEGSIDSCQVEQRHFHKDGSIVWGLHSISMVRNEDDAPLFFVSQIIDITARKKAESNLLEKDAIIANFYEHAPLMMGVTERYEDKRLILRVNKLTAQLFRTTPEEMQYRYMHEFGDNAEYNALWNENYDRVERTGQPCTFELTQSHDGKELTLSNTLTYIGDSHKGRKRFAFIVRDVTEERKAKLELIRVKEMLEETSRVARVGAWEFDMSNNQLFWSPVTREIHEVPQDYEPNMEKAHSFYQEESRKHIEEAVSKSIEYNEGFEVELPLLTAQNNQIWVRAMGKADMQDGKGRIFGTLQDVTAQKNTELNLIKAKEQADEANQAKSEFLANMSHEIRTPLNSVIGFSDLLVKNSLNDTQQQYVQAIHRSANSLMDLINDILDFSKIEAGKLELSVEKTDLWELSAHVAEITKYKANEKGLELLLHTSPEMPRFAQLDPVRIRQVLVNLMGNAIKFTEEGEVELSIVLVSVDEKTQEACLEFSVRDTGIGISPDKQEKIFEAFSQEDSSTTRKYGGTGLGLTISNKLLSLMGSRLELESKPGKGTRFFFNLNVPVSNNSLNEWEGLSDFRKVLVVDDNEQNCQILKDMLSLADIESDVAYNGLEALSKLGSRQQYDLMIIDYHMPYLDGLEVIRKTREELRLNAEEIPIVLLHSSYDDAHIRQVCKQLDVHVQIFKPITSQKLYTTLYRFRKSLVDQPKTETIEEVNTLNAENRSVLIVDDVPFNVQLAGSMVQTLLPQMQILEAKNGREALKIFSEQKPDLVLLDIQMPGMSGYEVSKEIRKLEKDCRVPIIAVTASTVKGEFERCLDAGMDDYLSKPILLDSLGKKLNKWLNLDEEHSTETSQAIGSEQQENGIAEHFDYEGFRQVLNVPESVIRSLISELLDQVRTSVAELQSAFEEQDFERMRKIGHRLKGSTSMGKMSRLSCLAEQLEKNKDMGQEDISQILIKIEQEASHVLTIIDSVLQQMQPS